MCGLSRRRGAVPIPPAHRQRERRAADGWYMLRRNTQGNPLQLVITAGYQGARASFCFQILHHTLQEEHQSAERPSEPRQPMPRKFSQGMQNPCTLLGSVCYQFSRDVVSGPFGQQPRLHPKCSFS